MTPDVIAIAATSAALITAAAPNLCQDDSDTRTLLWFAARVRAAGYGAWACATYALTGLDTPAPVTAAVYAAVTAATWSAVHPARPRTPREHHPMTAFLVTVAAVAALLLVAGGLIVSTYRERVGEAEFAQADADFVARTSHLTRALQAGE
ncbi:hypothetical protein ACQP25_44330 (plasmid) [Microtetraspora malaysiensis]|uniref:hypothetical protein n=1 Tax=Microtetraspora malaysiensis TaxID=161358 RepID=UPI003D8B5CED